MAFSVVEGDVVIRDASGNPVAIVLDNGVYRIESRSALVGQTEGAGAEKRVTVIDDPTIAAQKRLQVEAAIKPGTVLQTTVVTSALANQVTSLLLDGAASSMVVDGSVTPVSFVFNADPTDDVVLSRLRVVFTVGILDFNGLNFGKGGGLLANGLLVDAIVNDGIAVPLANVRQNEDFARFSGSFVSELGGANDFLIATLDFGGRTILKAGSGDRVRVQVRDNLTLAARDIKYLTATIYGTKE